MLTVLRRLSREREVDQLLLPNDLLAPDVPPRNECANFHRDEELSPGTGHARSRRRSHLLHILDRSNAVQGLPVLQGDLPLLKGGGRGRVRVHRGLPLSLLVFVLVASLGCATGGAVRKPGVASPSVGGGGVAVGGTPSGPDTAESLAGLLMSGGDRARLSAVARSRATVAERWSEYQIGPGDLLSVKVSDLPASVAPELEHGIRVSPAGAADLPLLGMVHLSGMTAREADETVTNLYKTRGILRHPEVAVDVTEFKCNTVTVIGEVAQPGRHPLSKPGANVFDMILAAGGVTSGAGRIVLFTPSSPSSGSSPAAIGARATDGREKKPGEQPIRIDLEVLLRSGLTDRDVNPYVVAGDVIRVAPQGNLQVEGYVEKPGAYPASPTTTLGGVVASAIAQPPADLHAVVVRRTLSPGEQTSFTVDTVAIAEGRAPEFALTDGDIVTVPAHVGKLVPYSIYNTVRSMVNVGVGGAIPLF